MLFFFVNEYTIWNNSKEYEDIYVNVVFLTLAGFNSIKEHGIYQDLLREFIKEGHNVYSVSPIEKDKERSDYLIEEERSIILRVGVGEIQKCNKLKK